MILRPSWADFKLIFFYIGKAILGLGMIMSVPLCVALVCREWGPALDLVVAMLACAAFWLFTENTCRTGRDLGWMHGMVVVSLGWLVAMCFGAIPHWLSGHFASYLDACFDLMSGYTTTGYTLIQDLDHVSCGLNTWRHLLTYAGGQGIIVIALTFMFSGGAGSFKLYVGEGREERLLPNVIGTARAIWMISLTYLAVGTLALWLTLCLEGMSAGRGFLQGSWLFMGAWSTAGFAPQGLNIIYYQSPAVELLTMLFFTLGSFNFALHWAVWTGNRKEPLKNIETRSFFVTVLLFTALLAVGFSQMGVFTGITEFFRRGFYNLLSGHTGTGNTTVYVATYAKDYGYAALWAVTMAMMVGGSACATCGGIKGIRMGIVFKTMWHNARQAVSPGDALTPVKVHHLRDLWLTDAMVRAAMFIFLSYLASYSIGALAGMAYGYDPAVAFFDSVSAGSTTGLSAGLTSPLMPALLKVVYIVEMWACRLEFVSVYALFGFMVAVLWRRRSG